MLGLLLGPVYYLFCEHLSGETRETFTLTERAARWTLPDGTLLHFVRGQVYRPLTLELDPAMNRIAFRLTFEAAPGRSEASTAFDEYQVTLLQVDQPIFERPLRVKLTPGAKSTVETGRLELYFPGAYEFLLEEVGVPRVEVSRVTLEVRQKIETLYLPLMWGGFAMLVAGLAVTLEPYLPRPRPR
jgi:hypothetical protein